uniref:Uncharacterized protein n=1 Tax=viral metagenome TaxID=1070528 RepID=A0A2V0RK56_9ZZZZ
MENSPTVGSTAASTQAVKSATLPGVKPLKPANSAQVRTIAIDAASLGVSNGYLVASRSTLAYAAVWTSDPAKNTVTVTEVFAMADDSPAKLSERIQTLTRAAKGGESFNGNVIPLVVNKHAPVPTRSTTYTWNANQNEWTGPDMLAPLVPLPTK